MTGAGGEVTRPSLLLRPGVTGRVVDGATGFQMGLTVTQAAQAQGS